MTTTQQPKLKVRLVSYPESNGKRNWTASIAREKPWKGLVGTNGGIVIAHSEYWNRVAYEAERAKFMLGIRDTEPYILDYGKDIQTPEEWKGEQGRPEKCRPQPPPGGCRTCADAAEVPYMEPCDSCRAWNNWRPKP